MKEKEEMGSCLPGSAFGSRALSVNIPKSQLDSEAPAQKTKMRGQAAPVIS